MLSSRRKKCASTAMEPVSLVREDVHPQINRVSMHSQIKHAFRLSCVLSLPDFARTCSCYTIATLELIPVSLLQNIECRLLQ